MYCNAVTYVRSVDDDPSSSVEKCAICQSRGTLRGGEEKEGGFVRLRADISSWKRRRPRGLVRRSEGLADEGMW